MRNDATPVQGQSLWWKETDPKRTYQRVLQAINMLDNTQSYRYERNLAHLKLYSAKALRDLTGEQGDMYNGATDLLMRLNVVQAVIDAACSQISTNRPRMYHLTVGGDHAKQMKAKKRTEWTDGQFYELDQYEKSTHVFQNAAIFGTGFEHVYAENGKVCADVIFPDDILVDDRESRDGAPRQAFRYFESSCEVLADKYPEFKSEIEHAHGGIRRNHLRNLSNSDMVGVMEAWHLPSGENSRDGLHALCISNATLILEEYVKPWFPWVPFRWGRRPLGYWGWGLAEILVPIQVELNYLLQKIQRCMTLATSQIWVQKNTKITKQTFSNEDFAVRQFQGAPPIFMNPPSISPEYFQQVRTLWQYGFEVSGVSQMTSTGVKPAGLNSGKALDTWNDVQSQRFLQVGQSYEGFHKVVAERMLDAARDVHEETGSYKVLGRSRKGFEYIKWADIAASNDDFAIQAYPTSFFSKTPSGKWKEIESMISAGFLSRDEAAALLDYPDLEAVTRVRNAQFNLLHRNIDAMLDGEERYPSPYDKLELAASFLPDVIAKAVEDDAPEGNVELLRQYLNVVIDMMKPKEQPGAPIDGTSTGVPGIPPSPGSQQPALPNGGGPGQLGLTGS